MEHLGSIGVGTLLVVFLLVVAAGVSALSNASRLPFTVLLVAVGALLAELSRRLGLEWLDSITLSEEMILFVFLPTLIFEAAYRIELPRLRDNLAAILTLATPGLLISMVIIGAIVSWGAGVPFLAALLLGAILSATDPVAVIATFKKLGVPKDLTVLVEGESLFNDATAIVTAQILLTIVTAGAVSAGVIGEGVLTFLIVFAGGLVVGTAFAVAAGWLLGRVADDPLIEISLMTALAYLSFIVAEGVLHVSGVMASLAAGLVMGSWGRTKVAPRTAEFVDQFWDFAAYAANALIFLLMGLLVDFGDLMEQGDVVMWVIAAMLFARALVVYGLTPAAVKLTNAPKVGPRTQTVMYWGGLRGAVALAVAFSLQETAYGDQFITVVMGAVLFTLFVQGMTIGPVVQALRFTKESPSERFERLEAEAEATEAAENRLPEIQRDGLISLSLASRLEGELGAHKDEIEADLNALRANKLSAQDQDKLIHRRAVMSEKAELHRLWADHHISEAAYRSLNYRLDQSLDALRTGRGAQEDLTQTISNPHVPAGQHHWWQRFTPQAAQSPKAFAEAYEALWASHNSAKAALIALQNEEDGEGEGESQHATLERVCRLYRQKRDQAARQLDVWAEQFPEFVAAAQERLARRLTEAARIDAIEHQMEIGVLPETTGKALTAKARKTIREQEAVDPKDLVLDPRTLLDQVPLFQDVGDESKTELAKSLRRRLVEAGAVMVREGDEGDAMFWIARGVVRVTRRNPQTNEPEPLATLLAGDFFGEAGLVTRQPRNASCVAVTPCELYELTRSEFEAFERVAPEAGQAVRKAAQERAVPSTEPSEA